MTVLDALADGAGASSGSSHASARTRARRSVRKDVTPAEKPRIGIATLAIPMRKVFDTLLSNANCIDDAKSAPAEPLGLDMWLPSRVPKAGKKDLSATAKAKASNAVRDALIGSLERCRRRLPLDGDHVCAICPGSTTQSIGGGGALRLYISAVFDDADDTVSCSVSCNARANAAKQSNSVVQEKNCSQAEIDVGERRQPYHAWATAGPAGMTMSEATVHK